MGTPGLTRHRVTEAQSGRAATKRSQEPEVRMKSRSFLPVVVRMTTS